MRARVELGARLHLLRSLAGLSTTVAGGIIGESADAVERGENGHQRVAVPHIAALLSGYGVTNADDLAEVQDLMRRANQPRWWQSARDLVPPWFERFLDLEQASSTIRSYECQWIPGLLQTADYARALISIEHTDPATIQRRVALRLRRQALLTAPEPPALRAVIDEAALRRPVGGAEVQRAQLAHLIEQADRPNITVQIATFDHGRHSAAGGSFALLNHPIAANPDATTSATSADDNTVYIEHLTGADYLDTPPDTRHYIQVMDRLGAELDPPEATPAILTAVHGRL